MMLPILLADDHAVVRDGLRAIIEREPDLVVVAAVDTGRDAVREAERLQPAVVLMDIAMPELGGIEAAVQIRASCPQTHVIVLSMYATAEHVFRALQAGVSGYVVKESAGSEVLLAIRSVQAGGRYMSERIASIVVEGYVRQHHGSSPLDALSRRERQVLQAVVEGSSSADIARRFALSPKTVETYRARIMRKLGVTDFAGLVRFALQHGISVPVRAPDSAG
jgi:two-component system, NarL family, response regulator NreC